MRRVRLTSLCFLFLLLCGAAQAQRVIPAPEFESQFQRTQGWTGADGTYSYPLPGNRILWSFSDTFFGAVEAGKRKNFAFLNNSHVVQKGDSLTFLEAPSFVPPDGKGWFWMWDGVYDGEFSALLGQFDKEESGVFGFGFKQVGLWHVRAELKSSPPRLEALEYQKLPFFERRGKEQLTFGVAVFREGAWDYILGAHDQGLERHARLARVPRGGLAKAGLWRFFDGERWVRDPWAGKSLFSDSSMEASLHKTAQGSYVYIGSVATSGRIVARRAPSLTGPWSELKDIYQAPEASGEVIVYNAKAHPHLCSDRRILISYNVNTTSLTRVVEEADIYRPRFFWWDPGSGDWF